LRRLFYTGLLFGCGHAHGQIEFYSTSNNGELIRANTVDCASQSLGNFGSFIDIAITPNGRIYGLDTYIMELNLTEHTATQIGIPYNASGIYSAGTGLAALDDDHLISDRFDSLFVIDLANGSASPLGKTGFFCMGDLTFHEGQLYMVSETNNLICITLDPVTHMVISVSNRGLLQTPTKMIYSLFSTFETCYSTSPSLFAIDNNLVFRVDPDNATVTEVCALDGGISYGSAAVSAPVQQEAPETVIPNVFTPNNDGLNDYLVVPGTAHVSSFTVTNRWGQVVYDSNGHTVSWNGTSPDGQPLEEGVYFYRATIEQCTVIKELHGFLSLER
jgi:gliding motility-associated-like protein